MSGLRLAIVGCGLVGGKRARAIRPEDTVIACHDVDARACERLANAHRAVACSTLEQLLALAPQVVAIATVHDRLAELAEQALQAGAHVLVEKPAGLSSAQIDRLSACRDAAGLLVKVGFNHRFHPGLERVAEELRRESGGELMHLRACYGHGGRVGYEREWRAEPARSGGGELVDQGMHLLDLVHWLAGPLPLHSALLRSQFWEAPVEDNVALILGEPELRRGPWAMLHVSWTEWKNRFAMEIFCRSAKFELEGLAGSYGPQRLRIYRMGPELGPPTLEEHRYADEDPSWRGEWSHFAETIESGTERALLGGLADARYAWTQIEAAYASSPSAQDLAPLAAGTVS